MSPLEEAPDGGFTLVELLISMVVMLVLLSVTLTAVVASNSAVNTTAQQQGLSEEARQAINRMARDLRQANAIVTAVNPDGPGHVTGGLVAVRLTADFDGDGCISGATGCAAHDASNPEDITYCFEPSTQQLYVIDNGVTGVTPISATSASCSGGQPLLAGNVQDFMLEYRSNEYRYDVDPSDGVSTWREVDSTPPVGNQNGLLDQELTKVDSVVINVTMTISGKKQAYRTQVDLRNRSQ